MPAQRIVHTFPQGHRWVNLQNNRVITRHRSLEDALAAGKLLATNARAEHFVHDQTGRIRERLTYQTEAAREPANGLTR